MRRHLYFGCGPISLSCMLYATWNTKRSMFRNEKKKKTKNACDGEHDERASNCMQIYVYMVWIYVFCTHFVLPFHTAKDTFYRCKFNLSAKSFTGKVFINASTIRAQLNSILVRIIFILVVYRQWGRLTLTFPIAYTFNTLCTKNKCKTTTSVCGLTQYWILIYFLIKNFTNNFRLYG